MLNFFNENPEILSYIIIVLLEIFPKHYNLIHFELIVLKLSRFISNEQRSIINPANEDKIER